MATKLEDYVRMACDTAAEVTKSVENWTGFLATAANLYRYSFLDQLQIWAQRPSVKACAEFDIWTKRMKYYVRRGSKGIALVNIQNGRPTLRHVFDIKDTGRKKDSHNLYLWQYKAEYQETVTKALAKYFGVTCNGNFIAFLGSLASKLAKSYWKNYRQDILSAAEGSSLGGLDERSFKIKFCNLAAYSIAYVLLLRCSFQPGNYHDVFKDISAFDTQNAIKILGHVVSEASGDVLHQIAIAIFAYERARNEVKRTENPEQPNDKNAGTKAEKRKQPSSFIITVNNDPAPQPSIEEIYEQYKPIIKDFLLSDTAYMNTCRNSDKENAELEGEAAVRRAANSITDLRFLKLYYDLRDFHNQILHEVLTETYPMLVKTQEPAVPEAGQDTDDTPADVQQTTKEEPIPEESANPADNTATEPSQDDTPADIQQPTVEEQFPEKSITPAPDTAAEPEPEETPTEYDIPEADIQPDGQFTLVIPEHKPQGLPVAENFTITDDQLGAGGPKAKFNMNMAAIATLKQIESENRTATPDEQQVLSQYVGWGGIPDAFDNTKSDWQKEYQELKDVLTPEEYTSARASTLNAHYTSPVVIKAIYAAIGNLGFKSGNVLEPAMGIGNFFGILPENMSKSKLYGVELDSISGRIAKLLYPGAKIQITGYEKTNYPNDFFDLAVGNVPFGQYKVNDAAYNKLGFSIHNYFLAKALDQVRPGGILAFVTTRFTMDSKDQTVRKYLAGKADLLGAIRLPNNAFKSNANTEVVSDILFMQKRDTPATEMPAWVQTEENTDGYAINSYFINHPDMVLGIPASESTAYGRDYTVLPVPDANLAEQLQNAVSHINGCYRAAAPADPDETAHADIRLADPDVKNYSFTIVDGEVYYRENSIMTKQQLNTTVKNRVKSLVALRDFTHELIHLQMDEFTPDSAITAQQVELNRLYDGFTNKYGLINDRANRLAFDKDASYYLLCSLEILDDKGKLERKADMFSKRTIKPHKSVTHVDTASEALTVSIGEHAKVDLPFMAQLTGKSEPELIKELRGVIYRDPVKDTWQTADEYLSGNVRRKLRQAKKAAEQDADYQINVDALVKIQPKELDASEIEVRLGSTWIDASHIQQFVVEILHLPYDLRNVIKVNFSPITSTWFINNKSKISRNDVTAHTTYGTNRASAYRILEDSLNLRDVRIYDTVEDTEGREKRVLNVKETTLAQQKQQALREAFQDWIFKDVDRRQALVKLYNELMNSIRPREYDGSHIVFSGINPAITLQSHQRNAIARVLYGGNTLLAHTVGAGKSFEMIAAAMESKRLGLCHKAICVVPNHLIEQMAAEWLRLYPAANILVTTKKDFETANRKKFCARIATSDIDAVIIGHSQFERIPISSARQESLIQSQINEITEGIAEVEASGGERFTIKQLERTKKSLEERLKKLQANHRKDNVVTFEELGVDLMLVDESDNYKNLYLYTKMHNVAGLSTTGAQKSSDLFMKCRYLDEITGGRGIVFATGTPISNSMSEMYTIQRYLQYDRLQEMGMGHFDCWASRFGETTTSFDVALQL